MIFVMLNSDFLYVDMHGVLCLEMVSVISEVHEKCVVRYRFPDR
jgi:hypothetical protein